ncbi:hypothetical protein DFP73DRAFT_523728 [Morchella snyderi]|nr:hypothetical protein DFP73DRAFT_523728 [Morchella snyderi]
MPSNPTTIPTTHPTSTPPRTHLLIYRLFIYLLLFAPPSTAQAQVTPFPFPALPQEFASKTACREVYDQCMQAFRDCLAAVAGNEPGRLGCEAYRNDVCEEHIRAGCDQLPNGGGSIGEGGVKDVGSRAGADGCAYAYAGPSRPYHGSRYGCSNNNHYYSPATAGTAKVDNNANIHGYRINIGDVGARLANSYGDYNCGGCDHGPDYKRSSDEGVVV